MTKDPFQAVTPEARAQARALLDAATFAALAVTQNGTPSVTRIGLAITEDGAPLSLVSSLSPHTAALDSDPACALLVGEPGPKGDPLIHPRLTLHCTARLIARDAPEHTPLRARFLSQRPKAGLYADFGDFRFVVFDVQDALLNGGFGKAYRFDAAP
ncbi:MAG: pyridoxamine 5'-phosphate oxidase family protein [Pseudomonadota bacterium]